MPRNPRAYRPIALAVLLVISLSLVTAYFREGEDGSLHRAQRWFGATFAPADGVVQRIAQPFRDAGGWVDDVQKARGERDRLQRENARLRQELADARADRQLAAELAAELRYVRSTQFPGRDGYVAHGARVIVRSPSLYARKVLLDQGSAQRIAVGDPVVSGVVSGTYTGAALVGRVTAVSASTAEVTLISDPQMAVSASVAGQPGADGILQPNAADPSTQVLDFIKLTYNVTAGDLVVTSGFIDRSLDLRSYFPPGIPIGVVTYVSQNDTDPYKTIQVAPWVDMNAFRTAVVLTRKPR
jgi:rod shape-determining protein MreC